MAPPGSTVVIENGGDNNAQPQPDTGSELPSKVFTLPELLENILQSLNAVDLFRLQCVNTTFKDTIARSKKIRKRMFLEPWDMAKNEEQNKALVDFLKLGLVDDMTAPFEVRGTSILVQDSETDDFIDNYAPMIIIVKSFTNVCEDAELFAPGKGRRERMKERRNGHGSWSGILVTTTGVPTNLRYPAYRYGTFFDRFCKDMLLGGNVTLGELAGKCFDAMKQTVKERKEGGCGGCIMDREDAQKYPDLVIYQKW